MKILKNIIHFLKDPFFAILSIFKVALISLWKYILFGIATILAFVINPLLGLFLFFFILFLVEDRYIGKLSDAIKELKEKIEILENKIGK